MKIQQIYPWIDEAEKKILNKVLDSTYITEGPKTAYFEKYASKFICSKYTIAVNNWTMGMYISLKVLNIGYGDEVIIPNLTFIATAVAPIMAGAKVVLCEINENDLCIDTEKVSQLITKKTKAIIPVHLYGNCCDMSKLKKICKKNKIFMIEDAAQSYGSKYKKRYLGTYGEISGMSLYGNKNITSGEGGLIFTQKKSLARKINKFKNFGRTSKGSYIHNDYGINAKFTDLQASIGIAQLDKYRKILKKKKSIETIYKDNLKNINEVKFIQTRKFCEQAHWMINIIAKNPLKLRNFLSKFGIETRKTFYPLNEQKCFNMKNVTNLKSRFPISKYIYKNLISLPSGYHLNKYKINFICNKIKLFYLK